MEKIGIDKNKQKKKEKCHKRGTKREEGGRSDRKGREMRKREDAVTRA